MSIFSSLVGSPAFKVPPLCDNVITFVDVFTSNVLTPSIDVYIITVHHGSDDTVCKGDGLVDEKPGFSDPRETKTPEPIEMKFDIIDFTPHAKFGVPVPTGGGGVTYAWSCRPPVCFYTSYFFTSSRTCTDRTV